jgi:ABC-type lipoprotein release transport system permease subunit
MLLMKIAYRNIWRNKRRTAFVLIAVGVSAFAFLIFMSMQDGIMRNMNDTVQIFETGHVRVVSEEYEAEKELMPVQYPVADGENWGELTSLIQEIPGVSAVFPRITTMTALQESTIRHAIL